MLGTESFWLWILWLSVVVFALTVEWKSFRSGREVIGPVAGRWMKPETSFRVAAVSFAAMTLSAAALAYFIRTS